VLTSGGDGIFPKGLLVGRVTKVTPGGDLFLNIRVRPAANLSRLEEVLVVTKIDERQAEPDQAGTARAVDILAERLPGVPSKPEEAGKNGPAATAAASAGETTSGGTKPAASTSAPPTVAPANAGSNAGSDAKKSSSPPPQASGVAPAARPNAVSSASAAGSATSSAVSAAPTSGIRLGASPASTAPGARGDAAKVSPKPVKAAVQPKPQPAVEDSPH